MFNKNHKSVSLRIALILVFIAGVVEAMPARASAETTNATVSVSNFLNEDGTLKVDGNASASFQADSWNLQLDSDLGPSFSPENREAFSPLASSTLGQWSALGSNADGTDGAISMPASWAEEVDVIAVSGTDVYVGGCFQNAGGDPTADFIAKWDALTASWSGIGDDGAGTPNGALKSCIRALVVNGDDVYVGGYPTLWVGGAPVPQAVYLAKWNGTSWSGMGISLGDQVTSIAVSGNDVYVGGFFQNIYKWDGANWSALGNGVNGIVEVIKILGSDLYVGGGFTAVYNGSDPVPEAAYIAKWDGTNWSALGSNGGLPGGPINDSVYGLVTDGTNFYVAGAFTDINNYGTVLSAADYIAKWDTVTENWSALGSNGNGSLSGPPIAIQIHGSDLYVGGAFTNIDNNGTVLTAADYVAKWDGTNWSALGSDGSENGSLNHNVHTLGLVGDKLYVGGRFANVNNNGTVLNTADYIAAYAIGDGIFRVATDGISASYCGKDWSTPCDLQYALTSMGTPGDELWVKAGTYKPTTSTDRTISFTLNNGVAIYGGFAGTETLRTQRDPSTNVTILSGEIGAGGTTDNSYHVVLGSGTNATTVLDGFTITAGNAGDFDDYYGVGGGMYISNGNPTLTNLSFSGNSALNGGGISNHNSSPSLTHVTFNGNSASLGGGMYNEYYSNPILMDVVFNNNSASGGGMFNHYSSPNLTNVTFSGNTGGVEGGGMYNQNSSPTLTNVTFSSNSAPLGGGMYNAGGSPTLLNVTFSSNSANRGGGMYNGNSSPTLTNVTFSSNTVSISGSGGGMYNDGSPTLTNVIIANSSGEDCIGTSLNGSSSNNLIEDATNACGLTNGVNGNIIGLDPDLGPLANNGGFTQTMALLSGSPAIDAGDDATCPETDQRGVTRPQGLTCDIGAYEYQPVIHYVKWNATGANNGTSWTDAYTDLQSAFSAASSGAEIWVAAGTYKPTTSTDRESTFVLKDGVAIYGGFAGSENLREQRNPSVNITILSGDLNGDDNNNISYDESTRAENVYHVVASFNIGASAILDGFTITSGNANVDDGVHSHSGGGMWSGIGSPTLNNIIFTNNSALEAAGGIFITDGSSPNLSNTSFINNNSADEGGGMEAVSGSAPTLKNVVFNGNSARHGGGAAIVGSTVTILDTTFVGNTAIDDAGGLGLYNAGAFITGSAFIDNHVVSDGNPTDYRVEGGGLYNYYSHPEVVNSTFSGNTAENGGSGIGNVDSNPILTNITVVGNADGIKNGSHFMISNPVIMNSIVWGNIGGEIVNANGSTPIITHSIIQGGYTGTGNLDADPLLDSLANNGGFTQTMALGIGSPAINTGDDATCPDTDQRGVTRPQESHCDIGAYEYVAPPTPTPTYTPTFTPTSTPTNTPTPSPTFTPTFTPTSTSTNTPTPTNTFTPTATPPYSYNPLYLSLTSSQTIGGVSSADEDILKFDGQTWSLFFDGSDVGVASPDLFAFSMLDSDSILMSFSANVTVNGITATPQDILRFDATSLGSVTAGTFSMYLDGSDVGLDTSSESIDSLSLLPDGRILISTTSSPAVSGVSGKDEDVLAFTPTSLGDVTAGTWAMYFDGSDVGLADASGEDVDALDVIGGNIYLSTLDNFAVPGVSGADEDVFICVPTSLGNVTACNYSSSLYFDGSTWGLSSNDVDAFNFLAVGPIPTSMPTNTPSNTPTPTNTPTQTPSPTVTFTPTVTKTSTPTSTSTVGPSPTPTYTATNTATATSTATVTATFTPTTTSTAPPSQTFTPSPTSAVSDLIFANGFENGNLSTWTSASTGGGDLSVNPSAALVGSHGMQVLINDTTNLYVTDETPNAETRYRARFYFDPNSITISDGNAQYIFVGYDASSVFQVDFRFSAGSYQIRLRQNNDAGSVSSTNWVTISDAPHSIELEWWAASAVGANNGGATLWIDGVQSGGLTNIDNDTRRIDRMVLGAVSGIDAGTLGTYFMDAFESRRQTYIGP